MFSKSDRINSESGVVLIVFAVFALMLVTFAALAVEVYISSASRERMYKIAQMTALGSIEAYFRSDADSEEGRRDDAQDRAQRLLETQFNSDSYLVGNEAFNLEYNEGDDLSFVNDTIKMQGGRYYFVPPTEDSDPCSGNYPCYIPEPDKSQTINAFKIRASMPETSWYGFLAPRSEGLRIRVETIATTVPRLGVFLVDLSGSMDDNTHRLRPNWQQHKDPEEGHGVKPAYVLSRDNTGPLPGWPSDDGVTLPCPDNSSLEGNPRDQAWINRYEPDCGICELFYPMECVYHTRPAGDPDPLQHYGNDYAIIKTFGDTDRDRLETLLGSAERAAIHPDPNVDPRFSVGPEGLYHRIEVYQSGDYEGPQPYVDVIRGLRSAVRSFRDNAVAGDKLGIVFFDDTLSWSRTILPTDDFDYVLSLLNTRVPTGFTPDDPADYPADVGLGFGIVRMVRFGLFPGIENTRHSLVDGRIETTSFTNLPMALNEGLRMLNEAAIEGIPTVSFMTLISNGITNCNTDGICEQTYERHIESVNQANEIVVDQLAPAGIPLHVILLGDDVAPHIALRKDMSDGDCLTDDELRQLDIPYVLGGDRDGRPYLNDDQRENAFLSRRPRAETEREETVAEGIPWFNANAYMYNLAKRSQGFWIPILNKADDCPEDCLDARSRDPVCLSDMQAAGERAFAEAEAICNGFTTPEDVQRWYDDLRCRGTRAQVEDAIQQIVQAAPYMIAELSY